MSDLPPRVTVGLVDGQTKSGRIRKFTPFLQDLPIEADGASAAREFVAAEKVAYVAFLREEKEPFTPPPAKAIRYRVHLSGARSFVVFAEFPEGSNAVGFKAFSAGATDPHREYFFYHHGVNAREKDAPLGEMLVTSGVIKQDALDRAIEQQSENRKVPIGQILVEQRKVAATEIERAANLQARRHLRIGEVLTEAKLCSAEDIQHALTEQRARKGKRLGEVLIDLKIIAEHDLAKTLASKFDLPFVNLDELVLSATAPGEIPKDLIAKYGVLPVDSDPQSLTVAISDPLALEAIDVMRFHVSKRIDEVLVTGAQLKRYVAEYLEGADRATVNPEGRMDKILRSLANTNQAGNIEDDEAPEAPAVQTDTGIISLVNQIIIDAYLAGASDIHIEPNGKDRATTVRFRVDGDCIQYQEIPSTHRGAVISRVKIMAQLDISERRKPQDGKIRFKLTDKQIELRVATIPTVNNNEDIVLRILANSKPLPLEQLKLSARNLTELRKLLAQPYGLLLCVGPTGSGKTTTLHSALGSINTIDMKIWTAEDPVEITQPGLRQVQVHPRIGFTFAQAMRAFLRADPDVIMVGEMRDQETASTAVEASLTGHLVLSTLHTNSAPETITRLLDMGLDPFSFGDALLGVLAQRLARALCTSCRYQEPATDIERAEIIEHYGKERFKLDLGDVFGERFQVWRARGCDACGKSGYKGRVGLHELLVADDETKRAVARKGSVAEIREKAMAGGMRTLLQDGIAKALAGLTDMKQVLAVSSR